MGILNEEELNLRAETPIERVLTKDTINDVVSRLYNQKGSIEVDGETVKQAKQEYDQLVVEAQRRLYRVLNSLRPNMGASNRLSRDEIERELVFKGHDLNYERDKYSDTPLEYAQSGKWAAPLPEIRRPFDHVRDDFFEQPDIELFEKYYNDDFTDNANIEPYRSWLEYTTQYNDVLVEEARGRVKTRESFANKLADKLAGVHQGSRKISDFTGIRIIARTEERLRAMMDRLDTLDSGVHVVRRSDGNIIKDSIENPKPNGYKDLKAYLATEESENTHGIVELQGMTEALYEQNKQAERSHLTYKMDKYRKRFKNKPMWNTYRTIIGEIFGETNPIQLSKEESLKQ